MEKRAAVMDLGTNTFHLLIVEGDGDNYVELVHEQQPVKLGEGGINKGFIQQIAFERGIDCMVAYAKLIEENRVENVSVIGTSALRNAANGQSFISEVKDKTGLNIEIIDGETEAGYIYKGIQASGCLSANNSLIIDIGGGSVEFIICNDQSVKWKHSFEIGAARLMDLFHRHDPIPAESINALTLYLEEQLAFLFDAVGEFGIDKLIGSSGVFESYVALIAQERGEHAGVKQPKNYAFDRVELLKVIERIVLSTHQQRAGNPAIIPVRVDMIVSASILTRFVIEKLNIDHISMSTNSLKEGVLAEMLAN